LNSLTNQYFTNFEVVIVDDNGFFNDSVDKVIRDYSNSLRIKYIRNEENLGAAVSRNIGVQNASSDTTFISFLDSGDEFHSQKLLQEFSSIQGHTSIDFIYSRQLYNFGRYSLVHNHKPTRDILEQHILKSLCTTSCITVRKVSFLEIGGFSERLRSSQDWDLVYRLLVNRINVFFINEVLSTKNVDHGNSISSGVKKHDRTYIYVRIPILKQKKYRSLFPAVLLNYYMSRTFRSISIASSLNDFYIVSRLFYVNPKVYAKYFVKLILHLFKRLF